MPQTAWLIELTPRAPLRAGAHPEDIDRARPFASSDTVFGAVCWAMRQLFGESALSSWLNTLAASPAPTRLSSLLPLLRHREWSEPLLPLPERRPAAPLPDRKWLKRAQFVDREAYRWLLGGEGRAPAIVGNVLVAGKLLESRAAGDESLPRLWQVESRPRVTLDRLSGASVLYESAATYLSPAHATVTLSLALYCLADEAELDRLLVCLEFLGEAGIGGERSTGLGRFEVRSPVPSDLPLSSDPSAGATLALCWPSPADTEQGALQLPEDRGYRLVERSGWVASPEWAGWRSRRVTMLAEGSYVGGNGPGGGLVDCTPQTGQAHAVYRNGLGLFLEEAKL